MRGARIALARLRPWTAANVFKVAVVSALFGLFLWGDYALFRRLFSVVADIERLTPFFALGLIENLLGLVLLVGLLVLFSSALTTAIGSFFTDLDLETFHAAPVSRFSLLAARWRKALLHSSYLVVAFLSPLFLALGLEYGAGWRFYATAAAGLLLFVTAPVSLAAATVVVLVRFFPVRRVHQVTATLAILLSTLVVIAFRIARPERLFSELDTDDVVTVLRAVELPTLRSFPSGWLASAAAAEAGGESGVGGIVLLAGTAAAAFALFALAGRAYYRAWVRARETSAPRMLGAGPLTALIDRVAAPLSPQMRAVVTKEARIVTRDAAQWSQLLMMVALLFIYVYNVQIMPLEGDARAILLAYLNLGMAGFVIAALSLRFAFPSASAEGKAYWIVASAPIGAGKILAAKCAVYAVPLVLLAIVLTAIVNVILEASVAIWAVTLPGAAMIAVTLVFMAVGVGAWSPDFTTENPIELAVSVAGFGYMAGSMLYVGLTMFLLARPVQRFFMRVVLGFGDDLSWWTDFLPVSIAVAVSIVVAGAPLLIAGNRLRAAFGK
jgi:ABC-2 type transport system permease protein